MADTDTTAPVDMAAAEAAGAAANQAAAQALVDKAHAAADAAKNAAQALSAVVATGPISTATSAEVAGAVAKVATVYDGFTVLMMTDMAQAVPNVATAINNLHLKQGDVLICFVGRAG